MKPDLNYQATKYVKLYEAGQFGDESDYMKWAGEIETLQRLKNEMSELGEVEVS